MQGSVQWASSQVAWRPLHSSYPFQLAHTSPSRLDGFARAAVAQSWAQLQRNLLAKGHYCGCKRGRRDRRLCTTDSVPTLSSASNFLGSQTVADDALAYTPGMERRLSKTDAFLERRAVLTKVASVATAILVGAAAGASAALARNTFPLEYVCKAGPCHPEEDPVAARIRKEIGFQEPMKSLGQTWDIKQLDQTKRGLQILYPPWIAGRWAVKSKYLGASLPLGKKFIGPTVPGARKGSIACVADIGFDPPEAYEQRFYVSELEGGVVADRGFNIAAALKAYWPEVAITSTAYDPAKNTTRLALDYTTPSKAQTVEGVGGVVSVGRVKRAVELFINNRESAYETPDAFLCTELYRQASLETGRAYDYQTNLALQRISDEEVLAKYTVGAFLNPQDGLYFDAGDRAVAIYAYSQRWRRMPEATTSSN